MSGNSSRCRVSRARGREWAAQGSARFGRRARETYKSGKLPRSPPRMPVSSLLWRSCRAVAPRSGIAPHTDARGGPRAARRAPAASTAGREQHPRLRSSAGQRDTAPTIGGLVAGHTDRPVRCFGGGQNEGERSNIRSLRSAPSPRGRGGGRGPARGGNTGNRAAARGRTERAGEDGARGRRTADSAASAARTHLLRRYSRRLWTLTRSSLASPGGKLSRSKYCGAISTSHSGSTTVTVRM